jgi:hypothetical protein
MRVNFLQASNGVALSKTFKEIAPGTYRETSYPQTFKFDSIERVITDIVELHDFIVACSAEGLCLLKGMLDQPLSNESRAGHTDATTTTEWICLDVDYTVTDKSPEEFLDELGFVDVSFVFQKSASMGIKTHEGWRGHFFILLDSPQSPQALKQWLIRTNLSSVSLRLNIGLSASGGALIYPLDVTTCQNDKLLYITPPECIGFDDPIEDRFELVLRAKPRATIDMEGVSAATNQQQIQKFIKSIRTVQGLPAKTFKTTQVRDVEVLTNPDAVTVTEKKESRGFVYLNLNGGDSWGYYFPKDSPEILYNFKGEPCMYMRDVDKDIYNEYNKQAGATNDALTESGYVPFGFLHPADDTYYRGMANPGTKELLWLYATGSKAKLRDFLVQNGLPPGKGWAVDEWQLEFDPTEESGADFQKQWVNTYRRSDYIRNAKRTTGGIPPVIDRVLTSVCVEEETKEYFLNWLASIFQTREKTNTAWILQGIQGTGKGVLFTHIISPLIGRDYCHEMTMDRLDDDFNAYLQDNILLFIDEANISDSRNGDRLLSRIKNLVTEPTQHIRGIRKNAIVRPSYTNIILASNHDEIITMDISDRRFNVAPRQETAIQLEYHDIVQIQSELTAFADYLNSYEVDFKNVKQVLLSEARDNLIKLSKTTIDAFFHSVINGDLVYFTQYLDNSIKPDLESIRYHDYALIVNRWIDSIGKETSVSRNELRLCYQFLQNTTISATKFTRMCNKYGLEMKTVRIGANVTRGISGIRWLLADDERQHHEETRKSNVVSIKEKL